MISSVTELQIHGVVAHSHWGEEFDPMDTDRQHQGALEDLLLQSTGKQGQEGASRLDESPGVAPL